MIVRQGTSMLVSQKKMLRHGAEFSVKARGETLGGSLAGEKEGVTGG